MKTLFYTNTNGLKHALSDGHPECPERLNTILKLIKEPIFNNIEIVESIPAELEQIYNVHEPNYVMSIQENTPDEGLFYLDGDTALCPHTWEAALSAAGAVCMAVDDLYNNKSDRAFCAVRPPGHHAQTNRAMGFCIFNNVLIGALHAKQTYNIEKIAIIDFDVHHGNGSQEIIEKLQTNFFYISTHQGAIFPGTGSVSENVENKILNIPLSSGTNSQEFKKVYNETVLPAIDAYAPELILISAGFDAHKDDPLASLNIDEEVYGWLTKKLCELANTHSNGNVISVLEGGYNLNAVEACTSQHLKALLL
jgi:acetoin utilization deacetylase AcuC-like enzyme